MLIQKQFNKWNSLDNQKIDTDDYATDAGDNDQFRFVLTVLEKIQEARLKFSLGSATVL